jgi:hypothetical protein
LIQAEGGTPITAISDLLRTAALLRTGSPQQKQQMLLAIAQQFGVPLGMAQGHMQGQPHGMPDISAHPFVQHLAGTVAQMQGHFTEQQKAAQAQVERTNAKAVQDFIGEADAKGQPKYPMDEALEGDFVVEIQLARSLHPDWDARRVLEAAYENLTWKTPSLRDLRLKKQEDERKAKEAEELAKKKQAGVQTKGSGPSNAGPSPVDIKDRRAVIANAMASVRR